MKRPTIKRIHVNQHVIRHNKATGERRAVLTIKTTAGNIYAHACEIDGPCRIVYSPDKPLDCGATVWIETSAPVRPSHVERGPDLAEPEVAT